MPGSGNNILVSTRLGPQSSVFSLTKVTLADKTTAFNVVMFNRNGGVLYNKVQTHASGKLTPVDLRVDSEGNAYVLAEFKQRPDSDVIIFKFNEDGVLLWSKTIVDRWLDPNWNLKHADEHAIELGLTSTSEAYVLHSEEGDPVKGKFAVLTKFSENGDLLWSRDYMNTLPTGYVPPRNWPKAMDINANGQAVILVQTSRTEGEDDEAVNMLDEITVATFDVNGNVMSQPTFGLTFQENPTADVPVDMALDSAGSAYVVGTVDLPLGLNGAIVQAQLLVKFTGGGVEWFRPTIQTDQFGRTGSYEPLTVTAVGTDLVVGGTISPFGAPSAMYAERHTAASMTWRFTGAKGKISAFTSDSSGNLFAAARRVASGTNGNEFYADVMQISATGGIVWSQSQSLVNNSQTNGVSVLVSGSDVLFGANLIEQPEGSPVRTIPSIGKFGQNPKVIALTATPSTMQGGTSFQLKVTLDKRAFAGGFPVQIEVDHSSVNVPVTMVIPVNQLSGTFTFTTDPVSSNRTVTLRAMPGATATTQVTLQTSYLETFTISKSDVVGGGELTGTVTLSGPAVGQGARVQLSSTSNNVILPKDNEIIVPGGQTSRTFTIRTRTVSADESPFISATFAATARQQLNIFAVTINGFTVPPTIKGGTNVTGTLSLTGPAPAGGLSVSVTSDNSSVPPQTVTIPAGSTEHSFLMATEPVARDTNVTLSASTPTKTLITNSTVLAPVVNELILSEPVVTSGGKSYLAVRINGPAPAGGLEVKLTSSDPSVATTLPSVIIPGGLRQVRVLVRAGVVSSTKTTTLTAEVGPSIKTINLTVNPAP